MGIPSIQQQIYRQARAHQAQLAVPEDALGKLSEIACWIAARQGKAMPDDLRPAIVLFASDHAMGSNVKGEGQDGSSAEQVRYVAEARAAVNLLAAGKADIQVVDIGVNGDLTGVEGVIHARIAASCAHIASTSAMSQEDYWEAVGIGEDLANKAVAAGANLLVAGDIGQGNHIAAAAVVCHLAGLAPMDVLGNDAGSFERLGQGDIIVLEEALARAQDTPSHDILRELGGYEIAAMAGFYRASARHGVPVLLDGFVSVAAALAAAAWDVRIAGWMMASHVTEYPGHREALDELGLEPLVNLNIAMGQGVGAAVVLPLLQSAIELHRGLPLRMTQDDGKSLGAKHAG